MKLNEQKPSRMLAEFTNLSILIIMKVERTGGNMTKYEGIFNRNSFPEQDPDFWQDLNVFIDVLEERLLIKNLQINKSKIKESKKQELTIKELETLERLVFWAACYGLKDKNAIIRILYQKGIIDTSVLEDEKKQMLNDLYNGNLFADAECGMIVKNGIQKEKHLRECFMSGFQYAVSMIAKILHDSDV